MATTADRTRWLQMVEGHWDHFARAGWVTKVSYTPYDPATDALGTAVEGIDAVARSESKRELAAPEGGRAFEITRRIHLRVSQMGGTAATKRGVVTTEDGTRYAVESVEVAAEGTRYACDTVRL